MERKLRKRGGDEEHNDKNPDGGERVVNCRRSNIFDNMLAIMEKYTNTLESLVDQRTTQLAEEKKKTEALLLRMLPRYFQTAVFELTE